jgi:hypothetical protein
MKYKPLVELEDVNTNCRIQLTETLDRYHNIRTVGGRGEETENRCRGVALFLAFDPWKTSLQCPPGSARFFDLAEKQKLLSSEEAALLSKILICHGAEMARHYNGAFGSFFSEPRVRTILRHVNHLQYLSESALAIGGSWADQFYELAPVPLQPSRHLQMQSFRQLTLQGELEFYSQTPWLAWIEALDLICLGPWAGLSADVIASMVHALGQRVTRLTVTSVQLSDQVRVRKVLLPMFSRGLQGVVVGLFIDVPKEQIEPIMTSLMQFGETLSDAYADLRWKAFIEALETDLDEDALARQVINVVSPIAKIIVRKQGTRAGYKIGYEESYWSGYEAMAKTELGERSAEGFSVVGPNGAEIFIEPLRDIPHVNPAFTRIRMENYLNEVFRAVAFTSIEETLPLRDVRQLLTEFSAYSQDTAVSLAKLRQYYVISKVEQHWHDGTVKITNNELKRFLESKGRDARNGYQVTSFASDFERIFSDRITATKTRNALSLFWNKGV